MILDRYQRQIRVPEFGETGQKQLSKTHITLIGGGGLGSHSANLLIRMGIGHLDIIDNDIIELGNLHRTTIFTEKDIGKPKSQILQNKLAKMNSTVTIKGYNMNVTADNIESLITETDLILDGTDNIPTRLLINETAIKYHIPWVYAGVFSTMGMIMAIKPTQTPCFKCISPQIPSTPSIPPPVFGSLPAIIASIQTTEALRLLLKQSLSGLLIYDIWKQRFEHLDIQRNPLCPCCTKQQYEYLKR